jgi:hypothetical protein
VDARFGVRENPRGEITRANAVLDRLCVVACFGKMCGENRGISV